MPTSLLALSPLIVSHVWEVHGELDRPIRVLDVGPGFGRYGLLCRELVDGIDRGTRIERLDAIEAEPRYRALFPWLEVIYDLVVDADVTDPNLALRSEVAAAEDIRGPAFQEAGGNFFSGYDLVLMLDVIEHLEHDAALELLDHIDGRVLLSTPRDYFDNPEADAGWETERHRSHFPDAASFRQPDRLERVEVDASLNYGANIVRLGPK